jgi:hypothetical protein
MAVNWEKYRKVDGSINLVLAFDEEVVRKASDEESWNVDAGYSYLEAVERMQRIVSRQAAAIAVQTAASLSMLFLEE